MARVLDYTGVGQHDLPLTAPTASGGALKAAETPDALECVSRSRRPGRPGIQSLLRHGAKDVVLLGEATRDGHTRRPGNRTGTIRDRTVGRRWP